MKELTHKQQVAFQAARNVIDRKRAEEIRQVKHWQHGMCGCLNAVKPGGPDVTDEEDTVIRALWETLPGNTPWMTALYMLCSHSPESKEVL